MGGQQPKIIFTEQDQAMENAIEIVFSESRHRLCFWHIPNNSKKHLAEIYSNPSFGAKFSQCLNGCLDEMEFQSTWEDMIKTFNLEDNVWLNRLYETRAKWCTAFEVDIFSAKMKTTLRSESMYSVFRQLLGASLSLIQVIEHYERKAEDMRKGERDDDLNCKNSAFSNVVPHGGILQHAANVYTTRLFEMFREEFLEGLEMSYIEVNGEGVATYELYKHGEKKVFTVKFDKSDYTISCSCKLFETLGLLCCHALRVFLVNNVNEIPAQYILRRWTNNARKEAICYPTESSNYASKSSHASRLSDLFHFGRFVFEKGSSTARAAKIVKEKLMEALELIENDLGNLNMVEGVNGKSIQSNIACVDNEMQWSDENMQVFDPTRGRKKNQLEKKSKKKVKGSADTQMLQPRCNPMLHSCSSDTAGISSSSTTPPSLSDAMIDYLLLILVQSFRTRFCAELHEKILIEGNSGEMYKDFVWLGVRARVDTINLINRNIVQVELSRIQSFTLHHISLAVKGLVWHCILRAWIVSFTKDEIQIERESLVTSVWSGSKSTYDILKSFEFEEKVKFQEIKL
uniref:Protein FAR1-RELATED SEQUENCE n=1 Tax=Ananas comosus var. bracteatus TaxID=296719 RepID=A0A6V7P8H5_ANACO|nr:unnamed protein product [Ananas comosus var. bracteatus]